MVLLPPPAAALPSAATWRNLKSRCPPARAKIVGQKDG